MADTQGFTGEVRMLIDGELVEAESGKRFENINPATEEVLGEVALSQAPRRATAIGILFARCAATDRRKTMFAGCFVAI
jgi:acyl-CoA reductase-like NAD-dependent aldehyde dehydrogenase